jgi:hypothetical protein
MKITRTIALALAGMTNAATAAEPGPHHTPAVTERLVMHNGSIMTVSMAPDRVVTIRYLEPKPSLRALGIIPGTVLVYGRWDDATRTFRGVAHVFGECGAVPYQVFGGVDPNESLVLTGPVPQRFEGSCVPFAYVWNHNSRLQFDRLPLEAEAYARTYPQPLEK